MTLNVGDTFTDPGHSVTDNVDTGLIATVTGSVNTSVPAIYTLNYNVSDAAGNAAAQVTRTVGFDSLLGTALAVGVEAIKYHQLYPDGEVS